MFKTAASRFILRALLFGAGGLVISLQAKLPGISGDDIFESVLASISATLAYAGIGAAVPQVEPFVGFKKADPNTPVEPNDLT